ncbi:uncharacterized protein PRCAT00006187001 [Priceomyces carsonii]|uniref:uncharacterized protein n=1 Tax=Priceomyces carsonii TaxID=28549 RepID=UPI002EDA0198|nr:unnamed protein product [Priceomyces carsonii]
MIHPFDPINAQEIRKATSIVKSHFSDVGPLRFKSVDILEVKKLEMVPILEDELKGIQPSRFPDRRIKVKFHKLKARQFVEAIVNISSGNLEESSNINGVQPPTDPDEQIEIENVCNNNEKVKDAIKKLKLPPDVQIINDPWIYGTDSPNETRRLFQCYMYASFSDDPEFNYYACPLPIAPIFDAESKALVCIQSLPLDIDPIDRGSNIAPFKGLTKNEYSATGLGAQNISKDLKPLLIEQFEGPSFSTNQNEVSWQNWKFRVGWNPREGLVFYNIRFDGRSIFYRLALNEMTVPYGDPRSPFHRKQVYDLGDSGFGSNANSLGLGCDCLGFIKYFDGAITNSVGEPVKLKNVICMHEVDNGIQWKHTNYRAPQVSSIVRKRELVIQTIATVSNYEYILMYYFDQAANIRLEVRATGILSTVPSKKDALLPFATRLGTAIQAHNHQHIFNLRIDPAMDSYTNNSIVFEDVVPSDENVDKFKDPFGVCFVAKPQTVKSPGAFDFNLETGRYFKMTNPNVLNKTSLKPIGYRLWHITSQMMLMKPGSYNVQRGRYCTKPFWVTKYNDGELYAAGEYTNQSTHDSGLGIWAARNEDIENDDCVLWHTFSLTHIPRPEDFPVMPVDMLSLELRPSGFFDKNPALSVPRSNPIVNRSKKVDNSDCCKM